MTMLDRMRRHKGWLKWSLALVVLAFIVLYIPSFMETDATGLGNNQVVASVDGRDITAARFRRVYQQQMQAYRGAYGANVDERMLKQLGIDQRIVQQMLEEETALAEAARLGISGWVRNLPGGDVEALFSGPEEAVDAMLEICRRGPRYAVVDCVEEAGPVEPATGPFEIRRSYPP